MYVARGVRLPGKEEDRGIQRTRHLGVRNMLSFEEFMTDKFG